MKRILKYLESGCDEESFNNIRKTDLTSINDI